MKQPPNGKIHFRRVDLILFHKALSWSENIRLMTRSFISLSFCLFLILGCSPEDQSSNSETWSEAEQLERDLKMYEQVWFEFLNNGDTLAVNAEHFTEDVTIITDQGNIEGIEGVRQCGIQGVGSSDRTSSTDAAV